MTDHIPADKIQEILTGISNGVYEVGAGRGVSGIAEDLRALLSTPTPRTLADMSPAEREACQWMQATFTKSPHEHIITQVFGKKARLLRRADGAMFEVYHDEVIPHLDEPRLEWPTEDTPEPEQAQPEDLKPDPQPGEAWLIEYRGERYEAVYWYSEIYAHWTFVHDGLSTVESPEATPVSRLVQERGDVS